MKALVILALTVFTGCHANLFYADQPKPQLELLKDAFWDYVAEAIRTAEDTLQMIRQSEMGQEVKAQITENTDAASEYIAIVQSQMTPLAQELMTKITQGAEQLKEHLEKELITLKVQLEPHAEELRTSVLQKVEQLKQAAAPHVESLDTKALGSALLQKGEELKGSLEQSVKDLQAELHPHAQELQIKMDQHLQDFHNSVMPLVESFQAQMALKSQEIKKNLCPFC